MRTEMLERLGLLVVGAGLSFACGSATGPGDSGGFGATSGAGGVTSGAGGGSAAGASGASGGAGGAIPSSGGAAGAGAGGSTGLECRDPGVTLASGSCYVPCVYAPGFPPRYEDPAGACTTIGWKCSAMQYCNPNIHCLVDASCQKYAGPGWICVAATDSPLVGQCAIQCQTDADCPDSKGATASPYKCLPVNGGTATVNICRF